jgi:hypothetical protein
MRLTSALLSVLCLAGLAAGCGKPASEPAAAAPAKPAAPAVQPVRLTYSVFFPPTHVHCKLAVEWAA